MEGNTPPKEDEPNSKIPPVRKCNRCGEELPNIISNNVCISNGKEVCRVCIEIIIDEKNSKKTDW
ncbi:MAG TPA: hypothetical protein VN026_00825 [Bacteroidia bacterium]|jgi:formylmethanofuran dehydrogenase subunit E|nr:hypothetical protein [Bacteroidia bacterium]